MNTAHVFQIVPRPQTAEATPIHEFSEERLALDFVNQHRHEARFVGDLAQWFIWDGARWQPDLRRQVFDWAREICRTAGALALGNVKTKQVARALTSAKTRYSVASLASDDQSSSQLSEDFDRDPLLLGGSGGTFHLSKGDE